MPLDHQSVESVSGRNRAARVEIPLRDNTTHKDVSPTHRVGSHRVGSREAGQGIIWSLLAMGLGACSLGHRGKGGGVATSDVSDVSEGTTELARGGPRGILVVDEATYANDFSGLAVNFSWLVDAERIPDNHSSFTYLWKFRDGTKIAGDGIRILGNGVALFLPTAIVGSQREDIVVEVTYTDNAGHTHAVTGRLDRQHGNNTTDSKDEFAGTGDVRDLFVVNTTQSNRDNADVITDFEATRDKLLFAFDSKNPEEENAVPLSLYVRYEALDSDGSVNDLVIYTDSGYASDTVLAILKDGGPDFRLTNDHVWEKATIVHKNADGSYTNDGATSAGADNLTGSNGDIDIFAINDYYDSNPTKTDVINNFNRADGDRIDLPNSGFASAVTVYYQASNALANDSDDEVVIYKDQGKTQLIAIIDHANYIPQTGDFLDEGIITQENI